MSYKASIVTINYNDKLGLSKTLIVLSIRVMIVLSLLLLMVSSDGSNELIQQNHSKSIIG